MINKCRAWVFWHEGTNDPYYPGENRIDEADLREYIEAHPPPVFDRDMLPSESAALVNDLIHDLTETEAPLCLLPNVTDEAAQWVQNMLNHFDGANVEPEADRIAEPMGMEHEA